MKYVTTKKLFTLILITIGIYAVLIAIGAGLGALGGNAMFGLFLGIGIGALLCGPYIIMNLIRLAEFKSSVKKLPETSGQIFDWKHARFFRGLASVIVKTDNKEFLSQTIYFVNTAKNLVGKDVKYVISEGILYITEVVNL